MSVRNQIVGEDLGRLLILSLDFCSKMVFENISTCHLPDARDRVEAGGEGVAG